MKPRLPLRPRLFLCGVLVALQSAAWSAEITYSYSYDSAGRLSSVRSGEGQRIAYTYDLAGNLLRREVEAFVDSDHDFMDDTWEGTHFGDLARDGTGDQDNDGQSDLHEFIAGTNPTSAASALKITVPEGSQSGVAIAWQSVAGKRYRVEYKDELGSANWSALPGEITAQGTSASAVDATAGAGAKRFYRVALID